VVRAGVAERDLEPRVLEERALLVGEQAAQTVEELVSLIAHEMKNPRLPRWEARAL
jgi:nitrogen-specific signal transduction histidine kinase